MKLQSKQGSTLRLATLAAALILSACAGAKPAHDVDAAEASRGLAADSSLNLRALRSVASAGGAFSEIAPIKAKDVQALLADNWKAFDSDIALSGIKLEKNTLKFTVARNSSAVDADGGIPRCSLNEDGNAPDSISVALSGDFTLKKAGNYEYVTYESRGQVDGKDNVVKSMNLQFAVAPSGEKSLVGFDVYDVSSGFKAPFNPFWSGKSVLCSREADSKSKTAQASE